MMASTSRLSRLRSFRSPRARAGTGIGDEGVMYGQEGEEHYENGLEENLQQDFRDERALTMNVTVQKPSSLRKESFPPRDARTSRWKKTIPIQPRSSETHWGRMHSFRKGSQEPPTFKKEDTIFTRFKGMFVFGKQNVLRQKVVASESSSSANENTHADESVPPTRSPPAPVSDAHSSPSTQAEGAEDTSTKYTIEHGKGEVHNATSLQYEADSNVRGERRKVPAHDRNMEEAERPRTITSHTDASISQGATLETEAEPFQSKDNGSAEGTLFVPKNSPENFFYLGVTYEENKDYESALKLFERAAKGGYAKAIPAISRCTTALQES